MTEKQAPRAITGGTGVAGQGEGSMTPAAKKAVAANKKTNNAVEAKPLVVAKQPVAAAPDEIVKGDLTNFPTAQAKREAARKTLNEFNEVLAVREKSKVRLPIKYEEVEKAILHLCVEGKVVGVMNRRSVNVGTGHKLVWVFRSGQNCPAYLEPMGYVCWGCRWRAKEFVKYLYKKGGQ